MGRVGRVIGNTTIFFLALGKKKVPSPPHPQVFFSGIALIQF